MLKKLQRLPKLTPRQSIPVELIQDKAYEIWAIRERNGENGTPEDDWSKAVELLNQDWWFVTSWKIDKRYQQLKVSAATSIKNAISFKTLSQAVNASVLIGAITFIAGEQQRRDLQVYQAWQVISAAHGQGGSGGRIQALEFLNSEPRRIPWFWLRWQRESLSGLEIPNAYLVPARNLDKKDGIQLSEANLNDTNLEGANLSSANLQKANLSSANLQRADLQKANLQRASLSSANLQRADLQKANLQEAFLLVANLQRANLQEANLKEAFLLKANLQRASLLNANLQKAILGGANLQGAILGKANLQGAILRETNLQDANLSVANLQNTSLSVANLQDAQYTDKTTSRERCSSYSDDYPCPTIFPPNFDPKAAGMMLVK
ncbi:MAG: pentapeptide repeat-containing protein [Nostoc sp. DedQUE08]|uniref:pentapeptide repeat-containing protein n=1 Tax=Nostoc sp. DedQUE08 TaxID=3075393 RepID=UPI002AD37E0A|nr:pentapeptide repeat-containing protein [Nostoc sp. DedQUE08]MDZ8069047.1 pentapeptide repeat-containing protein [Nostoc sp. DedQUE08]